MKLMTVGFLHELERAGSRSGLQTMCGEGGGQANVTIMGSCSGPGGRGAAERGPVMRPRGPRPCRVPGHPASSPPPLMYPGTAHCPQLGVHVLDVQHRARLGTPAASAYTSALRRAASTARRRAWSRRRGLYHVGEDDVVNRRARVVSRRRR